MKRTANSAGIRANWIKCLLYKVLLNLLIFPVLNIYCTEPYLGPVQRSYVCLYWQSHGSPIPIKFIVQFFECKIPERVLLNGAMSICRRFSKVSHWFEAKICGLSLPAIFTFWVFTLWHPTLVLYSKRKSSITASASLTTKLISKQARLAPTKSVLVMRAQRARPRSTTCKRKQNTVRLANLAVTFFTNICRPSIFCKTEEIHHFRW